jgi:hypothetical protein
MFKDRIPGAIDNMISAVDRIDVAAVIGQIKEIKDTVVKYKDEIGALVTGILAYNVAMKAAALTQSLINVLMAANPIGLLIISFAALAAVIYKIYKNWDALVSRMKQDAAEIVSKIVPGKQFDKTVLDWVGLKDTNQGVSESEYRTTAGYILGGRTTEGEIAKKVKERTQGMAEIGGILDQYKTAINTSGTAAQSGLSVKELAQAQQIAFNGKLTFENAPEGTTFEQSMTGAPLLDSNLGQQ